MSQWWICPADSQVVIDDASMSPVDCSSVAANIRLIWWYGTNGEILYKKTDRVKVREPFTDITPYINLFNSWMTIAKTTTPAITLAQAKAVKSSMVDALFASKRQLPTSYLGHQWDGSDNATGAMTDQIAAVSGTDAINSAVGGLAASVNSALSSLTDGVNSVNQSATANVNSVIASYGGSIAGATANLNQTFADANTFHKYNVDSVTSHQAAFASINGQGGGSAFPINPITVSPQPGGADVPVPSMGTVAMGTVAPTPTVPKPTVSATPATGPNITWPPLDGPPITLTYVQFTTLLSQLTSRRNSLQLTRTNHKNNIAAMTTVDAVIAYDITSGW